MNNGELGLSQCVWCRHRSAGGGTCRAFPEGIPPAIANNRHDHRERYDGDSGIRFEPEIVDIEVVDPDADSDFVPLSVGAALVSDPGDTVHGASETALFIDPEDAEYVFEIDELDSMQF